jgi:RNA polymerase sigma-70 factor (ECF subfamily)
MDADTFAGRFEAVRAELTRYLTRLTLRPAVAEELAQEAAVRGLQHLATLPEPAGELRAWLFRAATNLALDHRRKAGTVRETLMLDARRRAESSPEFADRTRPLLGSPVMASIAREHLAACLACALGRFPPERAAALLLVEMVGFTVAEAADILDARPAQVKGWLTATRAATEEQYGRTCALVAKQGVCYQCVELDRHFGAGRGDPLAGTPRRLDDRLAVLRDQPPGRWTQVLAGLLDEIG